MVLFVLASISLFPLECWVRLFTQRGMVCQLLFVRARRLCPALWAVPFTA